MSRGNRNRRQGGFKRNVELCSLNWSLFLKYKVEKVPQDREPASALLFQVIFWESWKKIIVGSLSVVLGSSSAECKMLIIWKHIKYALKLLE